MKPLYFDYNATTPMLPEVRQAMLPYLEAIYGNPGCGHAWGYAARQALDQARGQVAGLINCPPENLLFTSCATESNNWVLFGLLEGEKDARLVTSAIEHPAILEPAKVLEAKGLKVTRVGVDSQGLVSLDEVAAACTPDTRLISVMLANNETGAVQPLAEIAAWARPRGILVHSDAAQAVGKIPVDVKALGVDFLTIAGHKLYAPKGVGALYARNPSRLRPLLYGGGQEQGLRSGTENIPHMVGLGAACQLAGEDLIQEMTRQAQLGALFLQGLQGLGVDYRLHSAQAPRLPGTMSLGFGGLKAGDILSGLVGYDVGVSAGAACHGDATTISHVLAAMGVPKEYAEGTLRFSWGRPTSQGDVAELVHRLGLVLASLG
ncbi:MAG: cysteine desulfurase [Desulfarculus sp.]|nr:cysteine desulfurase [Desulfarculus sp.]